MNKTIHGIILFALISCSSSNNSPSQLSKEIEAEYKANTYKSINFSQLGNNTWTKVCFLGPYNENSTHTLGFTWEISAYTDVLHSDAHNVIIFATESEVIEFTTHTRNKGDFWRLSGKCFKRKLSHLKNKNNYWTPIGQ